MGTSLSPHGLEEGSSRDLKAFKTAAPSCLSQRPTAQLVLGQGLVLASWASFTKRHKPGDLQQERPTLSQFWRPEVCNQGVSRALLPSEAPVENHCLSFQKLLVAPRCRCPLACGSVTLIFAFVLAWLFLCPCAPPLLIRMQPIGLRTHP